MEHETINVDAKDFRQLVSDVAMIKSFLLYYKPCLDDEGELSDWAIKELDEARKTPKKEFISLGEIEKEFL